MSTASTNVNTIEEIKGVLNAIGAINNIYYESGSDLIFDSDCFSGVLKITIKPFLLIYWGTSWISTTTIANQFKISSSREGTGAAASIKISACRVEGKILAINNLYDSATHVGTSVIGKLTTGDTYSFGLDSHNANASLFKNHTTGLFSKILIPYHTGNGELLLPSGNLLRANIDRVENNLIIPDNLQNIKILCRSRTKSDVGIIRGNHVIITGGGAGSDSGYMPYDLVVVDGAI